MSSLEHLRAGLAEFRLAIAEIFIVRGLRMLPEGHIHSKHWRRAFEQAASDILTELIHERSRKRILERIAQHAEQSGGGQ